MQACSIAAAGMMSAQDRFEASARRTAARSLENLEQETVERIASRAAFEANAAVLKTAGEMLGTLVDLKA